MLLANQIAEFLNSVIELKNQCDLWHADVDSRNSKGVLLIFLWDGQESPQRIKFQDS